MTAVPRDMTYAEVMQAVTSSPYVTAAQAIAGIIDGARTRNWQEGVDDKLGRISEQLAHIEQKLDVVLKEITATREAIIRRINEAARNELVFDIRAEQRAIHAMLRKYAGQPLPIELHPVDRQHLFDWTATAVKLAYSLAQWGVDGFIALGDAYALLTVSVAVSGFAVFDVDTVRRDLLETIVAAATKYGREGNDALENAAALRTNLPAEGEWYIVRGGGAPGGAGSALTFIQVSGDARAGYVASRVERGNVLLPSPAGVPSTLREARKIGPSWKDFAPAPYSDAQAVFLGFVEALRARYVAEQATATDSLKLAEAAKLIITSMNPPA